MMSRQRAPVAVAVLVVLLVTLFTLSRAVGFRGDHPAFATPRESVTWTMAQAWAETGRPAVTEPALEEIPGGLGIALTPRDGAAAGDELLPKEFPLTVAMYAAALRLHSAIALELNPLQGLVLLVAVASLARQLSGSWRAGFFAALLLLTTLSFWSSSVTPVAADTMGVAALVSAATVSLQRRHGSDLSAGLVAGFLVAVAVASRYTLIGPGIVLLFCLGAVGPVSHRRLLAAAGGLALGLLPLLAYHQWVYGDPFTTGYAIGDAVFQREIGLQSGSLLSFGGENLANHARHYLVTPTVIGLTILAALGVVGSWRRPAVRASAASLAIIFVALFAFHGGQATWGSQSFVVNASLLRYLLIVFALLSVLGGIAVGRWSGERLVLAVPAILLAITSVLTTANSGAAGFLSSERQIENQAATRDEVLQVVPAEAIIVSRLGSKIFFPERRVMSASLLRQGEPAYLDPGQSVWELVPSPQQLAETLATIDGAGYQVFLHNDGAWLGVDQIDEIDARLAPFGLALVDRSTLNEPLFEIDPVERS